MKRNRDQPTADLRRQAEERARASAAAHPTAPSAGQARPRTEALQIHRISAEAQSGEPQRTQADREASQARFFDLAPVGYVVLSEQGSIREANLTSATLFGEVRAQLLKRSFPDFILPEDRDAFHRLRKELLKSGTPQECELRMLRAHAAPFPASLEVTVSRDAAGAAQIYVVLSDLTVRKQEQGTLQESLKAEKAHEDLARQFRADALYARQLLEVSPDLLATISPAGMIVDVNAATEQVTGQSRERLVGSHFSKLFTEPERARTAYGTVLAQGQVRDYPLTLLQPSGACRDFLFNATCYHDEHGKALGVFVAGRDITDRQKGEEAIHEAAARLEVAVRSGGVGIWDYDVVSNQLIWDDQMLRLYGITRDQFIGAYPAWQAGLHPDDRQRGNEEIQLAIRGVKAFDTEFRVFWPDGTIRHIRALASVQRDAAGRPLRVIGTNWDITERKQMEEALRVSEQSYRQQFDNNALVMLLVDPKDGAILKANPAALHFYGYSLERMLALRITDLNILPAAEVQDLIGSITQGHGFKFFAKHRLADGQVRELAVATSLIQYNERPALHSIIQDITVQKQAEAALRESEANFRVCFESMSDMIMVGTPDGRLLFTNSAVTRRLGHTPDALKGTLLLDLHPPNMRQEAKEIFASMFRGERESCPLPLMAKDGHYVPVETRIWLGKWNGKECLFGICKDLSAEQEAQQRFERLFRRNPSLMAVSSLPDRKFMDVNDAFLTTLGYARAEIIGKTAEELHLFSSAEQYAATSEPLMTKSRVASVEMQVRAKDGTLRDGVFSGELIDSQGRQYFLTVMSDITDRKRIEREMAKLAVIQRELMHLATDFVNVPLERQDAAINESLATMGQLIDADRAYLFAYDLDAGVMRNTHEWCGAGITPEIENLQAVPTSMVPEWVETHIHGHDLSIPSVAALSADSTLRALLEPQDIRSLVTLPLMQGGRCLGFVGFDAVRSERIWTDAELAILHVLAELYAHFEARRSMERSTLVLQQQLIEARDSAQAAAHAKSLFLANMSHEIRTPLNAVLGYAQIMEIECRTCPKGSRLTAITRSGEHLLSLLNDLLELVRGDTGVPTLTPVSFDFFQMLEDVRILFAERPEAQGLTLEVSPPGDVPQWLYADAGKLRQILVNLTSNATKYTVQGGVRLSATVLPGDGQADLTLAVEVEDTGCGIQAEDLDRIFNLFYVKEAPKNIKGTGLGLPLSQRLARALGGDITVRSSLGQGSCFRVTFRARAAAAGGATPPPRPARIRRLALDQRAYRLLVVDDDDANLAMIGSMLEMVGFTVETVASAAQALQRLSEADAGIDLVMMDKNMPMMDGYAATVQIRALPGGRTLPVLVVTASGFSNERERALAAGADGCIFKPVHREPLLAEIGRLLGVRYIHEPAVPAAAPSADTDPTALARLPAQQRSLLDQALRRGDAPQLRNLVQAIACEQPGLAAELRVLVEAYAYDRLRQLLDAVKGTAT